FDPHGEVPERCKQLAAAAGFTPADLDDRDQWLNWLLAEYVEPTLGQTRPTILYDYPASQAALAKTARNAEGQLIAERFELYVRGIELANGYHELLDSAELRARS